MALDDREFEQMEVWADRFGSDVVLREVEDAVRVPNVRSFGALLRTKIEKHEPLH